MDKTKGKKKVGVGGGESGKRDRVKRKERDGRERKSTERRERSGRESGEG